MVCHVTFYYVTNKNKMNSPKEIKTYIDVCAMLQGEALDVLDMPRFEEVTRIHNQLIDLDGRIEMGFTCKEEIKQAVRITKERIKLLIEKFNFEQ